MEIFLLSLFVLGLGFKLKWQGAKAFFTHKRTLLKVQWELHVPVHSFSYFLEF